MLLVLSMATSGDNVLPGDVAVTRFVQRAPQPPARWLADFATWIGSARVGVPIAAALGLALTALRRPGEAALIAVSTCARFFNGILKGIFDSSRPTEDLVRVPEVNEGLGYPSGHAMGSLLLFAACALVAGRSIRRRGLRITVQAACIATILIVGFGRIYVGAHWPSDVLGGYLWGLVLLGASVAVSRRVASRRL